MLSLFVAALATWQIVEIWHHSSLLAYARSRAETQEGKLAYLLACPFCLSPYVALICVVVMLLPSAWWLLSVPLQLIVQAFAVSRLANLGNDLAYKYCRTPRIKLGSTPHAMDFDKLWLPQGDIEENTTDGPPPISRHRTYRTSPDNPTSTRIKPEEDGP